MTYIYVLWDNYDGGQIIGVYDNMSASKSAFKNELKENREYIKKYCEVEGMDFEEEEAEIDRRIIKFDIKNPARFWGEGDFGSFIVTLEIREVK